MKQRYAYIFRISIILIFSSYLTVVAQDGQVSPLDSAKTDAPDSLDSKRKVKFITAIAPFLDYGKILTLPLAQEDKLEIGIQVELFNKIFVVTEFGFGDLVPPDSYTNANYSSSGNYYRLGLGYKIDMNAKNNLGISGRFAQSSFSDQGVVEIQSASGLYEDFEAPFVRSGLTATWYEIVLNSETKIFSKFYAGFFLRLRIMGNYDKQAPLDVYSIPGYGRTFDKTVPAFNFYLKFAFENID